MSAVVGTPYAETASETVSTLTFRTPTIKSEESERTSDCTGCVIQPAIDHVLFRYTNRPPLVAAYTFPRNSSTAFALAGVVNDSHASGAAKFTASGLEIASPPEVPT